MWKTGVLFPDTPFLFVATAHFHPLDKSFIRKHFENVVLLTVLVCLPKILRLFAGVRSSGRLCDFKMSWLQ